jgi:hypothetical protein
MMKNTEISLAQYLADLNAEKQAWMDAGPDRWTGFWVEDLNHWAEIGVFTVEDFKRYDLIQIIWEMYRDVTGIRPRHVDFDSMSYEDLVQEADYLSSQMERAIADEEDWLKQEQEWEAEQEAERAAWLAEQPEQIDYVAANYQDGWI